MEKNMFFLLRAYNFDFIHRLCVVLWVSQSNSNWTFHHNSNSIVRFCHSALSLSLNWFGNLFHSHNHNHKIAGTRFHHHFEISMPNSTSILPHRYTVVELKSWFQLFRHTTKQSWLPLTAQNTKQKTKNKKSKRTPNFWWWAKTLTQSDRPAVRAPAHAYAERQNSRVLWPLRRRSTYKPSSVSLCVCVVATADHMLCAGMMIFIFLCVIFFGCAGHFWLRVCVRTSRSACDLVIASECVRTHSHTAAQVK